MSINFEEDTAAPTNEQIGEISSLAKLQHSQEQAVDGFEAQLKEAKKALRQTQEQDLPGAMQAAGMEKFTTNTGIDVSVTENLYASIPAKNKPNAIAWLMDHGQSALIKEDISIPFDKGDHDDVEKLMKALRDMGYANANVKEAVHTGAVKSMIKEMLENGADVPLDLFGAYFHRKAVVKV